MYNPKFNVDDFIKFQYIIYKRASELGEAQGIMENKIFYSDGNIETINSDGSKDPNKTIIGLNIHFLGQNDGIPSVNVVLNINQIEMYDDEFDAYIEDYKKFRFLKDKLKL